MHLKSHRWWDLTAEDFRGLDMSGIVAIQPIGAVEQHGPHLPVRVDAAIGEGMIARAIELMSDDTPALVLPSQPVGKSDEHTSYAGTLSLSAETVGRLWYEIAESVHRAGCRRILFLNSHGGQPQVMEIVCRELRVKLGMLAVGTTCLRMFDKRDLFSASELKHGIHGGEVETSVMLHLHPDLVEMKRAQNFVPLSVELEAAGGLLTPEGAVGFGWQVQDLNPAGALGNAAAADARRGGELVERGAAALIKLVDEIAQFPLSRFSGWAATSGTSTRERTNADL
jgi:creatinine amidohydrolase